MNTVCSNQLFSRVNALHENRTLVLNLSNCDAWQIDCLSNFHFAQGGTSQVTGAKAILMRVSRKRADAEFEVFVLPGDRQLDSKALKKILKQQFADFKSFRFATATEMAQLTGGLIPGTMPPFAQSIFENIYYLYIDENLLQQESVGFNAGCLTRSIVTSIHDYLKVVSPKTIFAFSQSLNLKQR